MRLLIFIASIALFTACQNKKPATVGGILIPVELLNAADESGFDYTGLLAKAQKNDGEALQRLIEFSQKTEDSTVARQHGQVLAAILEQSNDGDEFFASVLGKAPEEVQKAVWSVLDITMSDSNLKMKTTAPLTWSALQPQDSAALHKGLYKPGDKYSTFMDCETPGLRFVAIDETGEIPTKYKQLLRFPYPGQAIYSEVKGYKTSYYGSATLPDNYAGFFIIIETIALQQKNYRNTCIPYEFWALGTEPFWAAQVSAKEAVIEFRDANEEKTRMFPYTAPFEQDSAKVYTSINQETGDNIRISVWEQTCNDGMSDRIYPLKVELTVNGNTFSGCGIPYGHTFAGESNEGQE